MNVGLEVMGQSSPPETNLRILLTYRGVVLLNQVQTVADLLPDVS
jgi:hypothetical protein